MRYTTKLKIKKRFATAAAVTVLAAGATAQVVAQVYTSPDGKNDHGVIGNVGVLQDLVADGVNGNVDVTGYLPGELRALVQDDESNQNMSVLIAGLQSATAAAQENTGNDAEAQNNLAKLAEALDTLKIIFDGQGTIPISSVSAAQKIADNQAQYEEAAHALADDLSAGTPAMTAFAAELGGNMPALKAGLAMEMKESYVTGSMDLGFTERLAAGQVLLFLEDHAEKQDMLDLIDTAQAATAAAMQDADVTEAQLENLKTFAQFLGAFRPVVATEGAISPAAQKNLQATILNIDMLGGAMMDLAGDYRNGEPAMQTFEETMSSPPPIKKAKAPKIS